MSALSDARPLWFIPMEDGDYKPSSEKRASRLFYCHRPPDLSRRVPLAGGYHHPCYSAWSARFHIGKVSGYGRGTCASALGTPTEGIFNLYTSVWLAINFLIRQIIIAHQIKHKLEFELIRHISQLSRSGKQNGPMMSCKSLRVRNIIEKKYVRHRTSVAHIAFCIGLSLRIYFNQDSKYEGVCLCAELAASAQTFCHVADTLTPVAMTLFMRNWETICKYRFVFKGILYR